MLKVSYLPCNYWSCTEFQDVLSGYQFDMQDGSLNRVHPLVQQGTMVCVPTKSGKFVSGVVCQRMMIKVLVDLDKRAQKTILPEYILDYDGKSATQFSFMESKIILICLAMTAWEFIQHNRPPAGDRLNQYGRDHFGPGLGLRERMQLPLRVGVKSLHKSSLLCNCICITDVLIRVNGRNVHDLPNVVIYQLLQGERGSYVLLEFVRREQDRLMVALMRGSQDFLTQMALKSELREELKSALLEDNYQVIVRSSQILILVCGGVSDLSDSQFTACGFDHCSISLPGYFAGSRSSFLLLGS